jgi:putative heme-binding domain-containing protein
VNQLVNSGNTPANALPFLVKAARSETLPDDVVSKAVIALAKLESPDAYAAMLDGIDQLDGGGAKKRKGGNTAEKARDAFLNSAKLDQHVELYEATAAKMEGKKALWSDAALLKIASRKVGSPEPPQHANTILDKGWADAKRRVQIISAAQQSKNHYYDSKIVAALGDADKNVAKAAKNAVDALKIDADKVRAAAKSTSPKIGTMKPEDVIAAVMKTKGDASRGPQIFMQATCFACHTTKKDEPPKGPYLGNIASIYPRRELAENILNPNKTIAMGFATHTITLKDGTVKTGFVVSEAADVVTIRDITAQEVKIPTANIAKRDKSETSMMPPGLTAGLTVEDFASLLTWLEQLAKQN